MPAILPPAKTQFADGNGVPLALGKVYFYVPGSLTPKDTWQDLDATVLNTNPVDLDSSGRAVIVGIGKYRQILKDALGNTIWDKETSARDTTNTVATIAALTALIAPTDNQFYEVLGYYDEGDGGGGGFFFNAASTATPNGGTILQPDAGGVGRWIRVETQVVTLRQFGCLPDTLDDTTKIQSALDSGAKFVICDGMFNHTFNELNDGQSIFGRGRGTGLKQKSGIEYYDGAATGSYGLSCKTGITWCGISSLEYDGNAVACVDRASNYSDIWNGSEPVQGRIKQGNIAFGELNRVGWVPPDSVTVDNVYSHDAVRNCFLFQLSGGVAMVSNIQAKNSDIDHLVYSDVSEFSQISNVILEGYWHAGAVATSGSQYVNLEIRDIVENPINDVLNGYNYECEKLIHDRGDTYGSKFTNVVVKGDLSKLNVSSTMRIGVQSNAIGTTINGFSIDFTVGADYAFDVFSFRAAGSVLGFNARGLTFYNAPDQMRLAALDPDALGKTIRATRIEDFYIEYHSGAVSKSAVPLVYCGGQTVTGLTVRGGEILGGAGSEGGCGYLLNDAVTGSLQNVNFEDIRGTRMNSATTAWTLTTKTGTINNIRFKGIKTRCLEPTGISLSYALVDECRFVDSDRQNPIRRQVALTTTDATVTDAWVLSEQQNGDVLSDDRAIWLAVKCVAMQSDGTNRAFYHKEGLFYRDGGGATQQGATVAVAEIESNAAWNLAFAVSGNDVKVQVTGAAGVNITWRLEVTGTVGPTP